MLLNKNNSSKEDCQKYLDNYRIQDRQYTTGLYDTGITIYKQQIRALNIFYALNKCNLVDSKTRICVIGGGVAGLTLTAAFMEAGTKVDLLEKESIFLHLQYGCDIRQVHPHIYDWPEAGSLFPYAKLPVLSWKAGSASEVADQIVQSFFLIQSTKKDCTYRLSVKEKPIVVKSDDGTYFTIRSWGKLNDSTKYNFFNLKADVIIYCTGFGIERGTEEDSKTPSYWRNDDYSQTVVNERNEFVVSGSGDGALIDIFRLKLLGFNYNSFLKFYYLYKDEKRITKTLNNIKTNWPNRKKETRDWLFLQFEELFESDFEYFDEYLRSGIRRDISVTLVSETEVYEILNLDKISLINALIFFLIYRYNDNTEKFFKHKIGKTEKAIGGYYNIIVTNKDKQIENEIINSNTTLIVRHGTDRRNAFLITEINKGDLDVLEAKQKAEKILNTSIPLWSYTSITELFKYPTLLRSYYTNETVSYCSNFISMLNTSIELACKSGIREDKYRITLLRVLQINKNHYYQQIAPYFGTNSSKGNVGKIFPITKGNVGLSIITGKPVHIVKTDEDLSSVWEVMELQNSSVIQKANTFLSIPILSRLANGHLATNLVLYLDASSVSFFDEDNILSSIIYSIKGFIDAVSKSFGKTLFMGDTTFEPISFQDDQIKLEKLYKGFEEIADKSCFKDINTRYINFWPRNKVLELNSFYSFDIYYNNSTSKNNEPENIL